MQACSVIHESVVVTGESPESMASVALSEGSVPEKTDPNYES